MLLRLFIAALWSPAGKWLTSWLSFVMFYCVFVTFPCGILGQVWYLIVSISDLCHLSYFDYLNKSSRYRLKVRFRSTKYWLHTRYAAQSTDCIPSSWGNCCLNTAWVASIIVSLGHPLSKIPSILIFSSWNRFRLISSTLKSQIASLTTSMLYPIVFSSDESLGPPISSSVQHFFSRISIAGSSLIASISRGLRCFLPGFFFPLINWRGDVRVLSVTVIIIYCHSQSQFDS